MKRGIAPTFDPALERPAASPAGDSRPAEREQHELRTEFPFELPRGYVDRYGNVHRRGVMRLATARDERVPQADDRVRENPQYLTVVLLARVITELGDLGEVHAGIVENFFASDLAFLQDLYRRINTEGHTRAAVTCPACNHEFAVDVAGGRLGEQVEAGS